MKTPTLEDYQNYTGLHCHKIWIEVGPYFVCPGCDRNKFELLKWTMRNPGKPTAFKDWVAMLHRHHDHSEHSMNRNSGRFSETIICGQCNAADGMAKRMHKLPEEFSFSPAEIRQFVRSTPHQKHEINFEKALQIYQTLHA